MEKLTIGRRRNCGMASENAISSADASEIEASSGWLSGIGLCTMCVMLILSMLPLSDESVRYSGEAVAVMSGAVEGETDDDDEREELVLPDKKASLVGEESFFETIGEFFASLIFGEG